jgi:hypothetical protein
MSTWRYNPDDVSPLLHRFKKLKYEIFTLNCIVIFRIPYYVKGPVYCAKQDLKD